MHKNFPWVLNDTLSLGNIRFHRTPFQNTLGVLVDLDGLETEPSSHGTIPFNAYDLMLAPRSGISDDWDYNRPSLHSPLEEVNAAAQYESYRHILEALFYILLWCVSNVPDQTLGWMENGHVLRHELLGLLKHPKERETFMWDASDVFAKIDANFEPLIEAWLRPLWLLVSEAHFACRRLPEEERNAKLEVMLTLNQVVKILRADGDFFDLRIAASIPVPGGDSDEL
jgi:hypothetical protein